MQSVRGIEQQRAARPGTVARDNILPLRDIFSWFRLKSPFIGSSPRAGKSADVTKHSNRQLLVLDGDGEARILGNSNPLCEKGWNYDLDTWQSRLRWWNLRKHFRVNNKRNYSILMGELFHSRSFGDVFRRLLRELSSLMNPPKPSTWPEIAFTLESRKSLDTINL